MEGLQWITHQTVSEISVFGKEIFSEVKNAVDSLDCELGNIKISSSKPAVHLHWIVRGLIFPVGSRRKPSDFTF